MVKIAAFGTASHLTGNIKKILCQWQHQAVTVFQQKEHRAACRPRPQTRQARQFAYQIIK
jgi:hypothetical protein